MMNLHTFYEVAARVLPHVPAPIAYRLCNALAHGGPWTPAWGNILANMQRVRPELGASDHHRFARGVVGNLLKNYYDLLRSQTMQAAEVAALYSIEGLGNGARVLAAGRGALVVTLHTGNFSLAFEPVARQLGCRIMVVVEQMHNPAVHRVLNGLRQRGEIEVLVADRDVVRPILRMLQSGGAVVLAQDRLVVAGRTRVQFFGRPVELPNGPATLARRTGAPLIPVHVTRRPDNRSRIVIDPPLLSVSGPDSVQRTTQALVHILEAYIRADPSQWVLTNNVWGAASAV